MHRDSDVDESESIHKRPNFDYLNLLIKVIQKVLNNVDLRGAVRVISGTLWNAHLEWTRRLVHRGKQTHQRVQIPLILRWVEEFEVRKIMHGQSALSR